MRAALSALALILLRLDEEAEPDFAVRSAIHAIKRAGYALHASLAAATLEGRQRARALALSRARAELALLTRQLGAAGFSVPLTVDEPGEAVEDEPLAEATAAAYVAAWQASAIRASLRWADAPNGHLAAVVSRTDEPLDARLRRSAATDSARAFNGEHDDLIWAALAEHEDATWFPAVLKRWDAQLDARVCPTCAKHDGETVLVGTSFEGGDEPGEVHDYCRCMDTLVFLPARLSGDAAPLQDFEDDDT